MKIEIEIRRTYNETITLTDDNLLEINDEYKGDVKRWVENNYSDLKAFEYFSTKGTNAK